MFLRQRSRKHLQVLVTLTLVFGLAAFAVFPTFAFADESPKTATVTADSFQAKTYVYRVINRFLHDANAFTQGLLVDGGKLYESTGLHGQSSLREVDLQTGRVLRMVQLPQRFFAEGLVRWQDRLIQLTWRSGVAFVYDAATFDLIGHYKYSTEGWGITHNGEHLIMSDGSAQLYFRDPDSFDVVKMLKVVDQHGQAVDKLNELEYIEGEIFANVWLSDRIARISPTTGKVLGWIVLTGLSKENQQSAQKGNVLNGIAYDQKKKRLYVTGKLWDKLYEIELIPEEN